VTFNDLTSPDRPLAGVYPTGLINWGSGCCWWLAAPWGQFTTNSISFLNDTQFSEPVTFGSPQVLRQLQAYNGGPGSSTITLACTGNPTISIAVAASHLSTLVTGWTVPCTTVTVGSSNGWNTNFDNLVVG
jgi:hypothetical protein